ncbi:hypothetical protein BpHYR1_006958 [Brachionus plicatilis]|uniref:Uncharacterized protein n=1 Tax=Brachionus plicatilis TaxID=10195 RepID=A0A3M7PMZ7_BRAPC|nr:hypothetical protein BpHYR1_006958 [Brachionus plicatilis]
MKKFNLMSENNLNLKKSLFKKITIERKTYQLKNIRDSYLIFCHKTLFSMNFFGRLRPKKHSTQS